MNLNSVHLNGLRAVEAVARCGSLQKAAEELGVSPSAVSQQINRTGKAARATLFERTAQRPGADGIRRAFTARLSAGFRELAQAVALAGPHLQHADCLGCAGLCLALAGAAPQPLLCAAIRKS